MQTASEASKELFDTLIIEGMDVRRLPADKYGENRNEILKCFKDNPHGLACALLQTRSAVIGNFDEEFGIPNFFFKACNNAAERIGEDAPDFLEAQKEEVFDIVKYSLHLTEEDRLSRFTPEELAMLTRITTPGVRVESGSKLAGNQFLSV